MMIEQEQRFRRRPLPWMPRSDISGGDSDGSANDDAVAVVDVTKEEATLGATLGVDNGGVILLAEGIV